jgi:hypothetical protein
MTDPLDAESEPQANILLPAFITESEEPPGAIKIDCRPKVLLPLFRGSNKTNPALTIQALAYPGGGEPPAQAVNQNPPPGHEGPKDTLGLSGFRRLARIHFLRIVRLSFDAIWSSDVLLCLHGMRSQPVL